MNWKKELDRKAQELNLEGGNNDRISIRTSNRNNNRSSNSIRNSISSKNRKNINNRKEEQLMITREAALDDLKKLEEEAPDEVSKVIVKVARVLIKMLATIRSNQLLTDEDKVRYKKAREARKATEQQKDVE